MVVPGRKSRDRRRKKERDNTRDSEEEETCTYDDVMNRAIASRDSGFFNSGIGSALGAQKKETVEEKKKPTTTTTTPTTTTRQKLVTENLSEEKSLTYDYQNGDPSTRPSTNGVSTSTPRGTINDMIEMASQESGLEKGLCGLGARRKEKVEKNEKKQKPLNHRHAQNRDLSLRPGTSGVGGTPGGRAVNGMSSMETLSGHIKTIAKKECFTIMKDFLTTALEKVEALEYKPTKRTIEYEQISPAETPKKKRELSPASSVDVPILVTTVQRSGSGIGQYPAVPCSGTSGNHHPVDGNMFVKTEQSVHVLRQYSSILPVENCVFFEPVHVSEGSRSVTSVTSSQWRQQWTTIDNDHHSVVSGVSTQWRQHRTTDDDNDSDDSGTMSPQSEKKSFFERQDLSKADEEQPEDTVLEDLSRNLLECSINGRSPRKTRNGDKSSDMYEMSSVKINMSTRSYVGSPSDRRPLDHVAPSPSRSQQPPNANQRPIIRQPRLSLPASPPQMVYDAGARNCRCPYCGSVWTSELELEEHYFEHLLGNRSCTVGGCEYTCSSRNELRRHIRAAHLRKHTCRRCGKAYLMASTLERHLRQCLPCRQCPLCPSACVDDASLCDHVASAHGAGQIACNRRPELRYYVCRECRFATTSRTVALDHCQRHILGEINLNITLCEICDLLFVTGDLHFLMHAVDDSLNRKSFQVVDFDWRVSLNARRQLESSLKKIKVTKAIKASIDEETSTARSNVEEINIETSDIVAPQTETLLKSQEIYNEDSRQENYNNSDLNQNEFDVTDKLIGTNLSPIGESNINMQDFMQKYLAQLRTVSQNQSPNTTQQEDVLEASTMNEPVQSETLVKRPLEQHNTVAMSQSNDNGDQMDQMDQSLPSCSTAEVQNQNSALYEETSTSITIPEEPNEKNLETQVILNDKEARDYSVEEITSLQENNKHTSLDHTNEFNKPNSSKLGENLDKVTDSTDKNYAQCGTDSKDQLLNTTQQEDVLEPSTMKEPVQSETLVERPLEQQTTVAMSQSNGNVGNNQSHPSSLTAEAQNQALDEETSTATNFEEFNVQTNDVITLSSEMHHHEEASIDSVEENTSLQQTNVNHTNKVNKPNLPKLYENIDQIKYFVQEIMELMQEAKKMKEPVQTEMLVELNKYHVRRKLIKTNLSRLGENINKMQDLMQKYLAQRGTVSKNQSPNTTQREDVLESSMMKEPVQSETLVERRLEHHNTVTISQSNVNVHNSQSLPSSSTVEEQNQNATLNEETPTAKTNIKESNVETDDISAAPSKIHLESQVIINDKEARVDSVKENTSLQENKKQMYLDHTKELNKPNASKLGEHLDKPTDVMNNKLAPCGTDSKSNLSNTTQQDDVLEANTIKEPVQSETLVEIPLEQPTLFKMSQTNGNVDNNQSISCSSAAEVQNQYVALDKEAIIARSNLEDSNLETTDIRSSPNEVNFESHVVLNGEEASDDSVKENTSLQENNKHTSLDYTNELNKPNSSQLRENLYHYGTGSKNQFPNTTQQENVLEANTMKDSVLSETSVERPLEQQTTVHMGQSNVNVDYNNQSLTSSLEAEVQNQIPALDEETPNARSNFEDSNVNTNDIMASSDETHLESQVIANDTEVRRDSVEENISLQENNKQTVLDYTNENNEPNLEQYDTDSNTQLSNTTQHQHILEASTMKDPEQSEKLVERPLEQQNTVKISQLNDNVDNNKSLPSSLAVEVQNHAAINDDSSSDIINFVEPNVETNRNTVNNDDIKPIIKEDVVNDQNLITVYASKSATVNQAYKTSTIESEVGVEKPNSAGEPKFSASKLDESPIITENEQNYEVNTNQTKEKKILIKYSQRKEEKNDETSIGNNGSVNVALSSIDINITISGTKHLSITAEEANLQNVVLNKATQTKVGEAMTSLSALEETNEREVLKRVQEPQDLTISEQSIRSSSPTEETHTKKVLTNMSLDETPAKDTKNSSSTNNETIKKGEFDKSQGETRAKESMSPGSPKEKSIINDVALDKGEHQICIELTKTLTIATEKTNPEKADQTDAEETKSSLATETIKKAQDQIITPTELTVRSGIQTRATNTNGETSSEVNKTVASTTEATYTEDVTTEKAKDLTSIANSKNAAKTAEENYTEEVIFENTQGQTSAKETGHLVVTAEKTDTIQVLIEKPHVESTTEKTMSSASAINETNIKATMDETQDHQARAELTLISGSQTEATTLNDETSEDKNKTVANTTEETDTNQVLTQKPHVESTTEKTMSSASANETNMKATMDETQDLQARAELTLISGSPAEATNANDETSGDKNKTVASTIEETYTIDVGIEKAKDLTRNANPKTSAKIIEESYPEEVVFEIIEETYTEEVVFENTHGQINAEGTENFVATSDENDTKHFLTQNSHDETTAKETKNSTSTINENDIKETKASDHTCAEETTNPGSPAEESSSKEISEDRTINEETKSSSCTEKTDSEEVLEKVQKSQNQTSTDKINSLEKTTKETGVKNHLQKTQDLNTDGKGMQNEKNLIDAKDETFPKTAATTSKKGQQRNRGRGRSNKITRT